MMSVVQWLEPPLKLCARGLITKATILVVRDITLAAVAPCQVVEDIVQARIPTVWLLDLLH